MAQTRKEILEERRRLRAEYAELFDQVQSLLFRDDPMGINYQTNTDEYDPEVGTILPRLRSCASGEEVCRVVHEEFVRWFGADTAGSREHYSNISTEIWHLWQRFRGPEPSASPNGGPAQPPVNSNAGGAPPSVT